MTTTSLFCAKIQPSCQTQRLILLLSVAGVLFLALYYPYLAYSQKLFCLLLMLLWSFMGVLLWRKNRVLAGMLWLNEEGELLFEKESHKQVGQLSRPFWPGRFACLISFFDESGQRHWLWLAHDAMEPAEYCQLNVLLKQSAEQHL